MRIRYREAESEDVDILWEFLAIAAYEDNVRSARSKSIVAMHLTGWKRPGDFGWLAIEERDSDGETFIGAIWARQFSPEENPFYYIDSHTPEISLAVTSRARGRGVGGHLIENLKQTAAHKDVGLCLNVRETNPAIRLYEKHGFVRMAGTTALNRTGGLSFGMTLKI